MPSTAVAEEVIQDAWIGVLRGIGKFQHRSTFRTWLFRIVINRAVARRHVMWIPEAPVSW